MATFFLSKDFRKSWGMSEILGKVAVWSKSPVVEVDVDVDCISSPGTNKK